MYGDITRAGFVNFKELMTVQVVEHDPNADEFRLKGDNNVRSNVKVNTVLFFECQMCGNSVTDIFKHELFFHR